MLAWDRPPVFLQQDKVASQGQARSSPLLSTQRTAPEEDSGPSHPVGHCPERPEVPLEALQSTEVRGHAGGSRMLIEGVRVGVLSTTACGPHAPVSAQGVRTMCQWVVTTACFS